MNMLNYIMSAEEFEKPWLVKNICDANPLLMRQLLRQSSVACGLVGILQGCGEGHISRFCLLGYACRHVRVTQ
jgi:hypothetical protein